MLSGTETAIYAKNNTQAIAHPFWSILGGYLDDYDVEQTTCSDDNTSPTCFTTPTCDYTLNFATMDALSAAAGSFPEICKGFYALGVLGKMLDGAMANYTAANDGYDTVFGAYVEYTKAMVPAAIKEFMAQPHGEGNQYFSCHFVETADGGSNQRTYNPCVVSFIHPFL